MALDDETVPGYRVTAVPFTAVELAGQFWAPRIATNRTVTIPFAFRMCEESGRIDLLRRAAASLAGDSNVDKTPPGYPFDDSDVYKVIEGAAYTLSVHPDPELEKYIDSLAEIIAAAQEPDGYLYPARTIDPQHPHRSAGSERWAMERAHSHELYNLGHLYEAAVAYYQATGKRNLLDIALKSAQLLVSAFGPGKEAIWPGHQGIEIALVKLYSVTGDERFLQLARFMLDSRGPDGAEGSGKEYNQSHLRVTEQTEATGHAVRATYMYAGMADVAALIGDAEYVAALDRIWQDVVERKLYVTGGIGASVQDEAFGPPYSLPNATAYCETCAAIGNVLWNQRMFLLHQDARYVDVLERTLYNGLISGVSLDGMLFFYENPLASERGYGRSPWFGCACCPSNLARFLPSLPGYLYARQANTIYINLYARSEAEITLDGGPRALLRQETLYPWDGKVRITVEPDAPASFEIKLRVPGWALDQALPSELYRFAGASPEGASLSVNGAGQPMSVHKEYVTLEREWHAGDCIELDLPMPVRRVEAGPSVEADRGKVALQRGPILYCLEEIDNPGRDVRSIGVPADTELKAEYRGDMLHGVVAVTGLNGQSSFTAVPYFAWANRGAGKMAVWLPES